MAVSPGAVGPLVSWELSLPSSGRISSLSQELQGRAVFASI